MSLIGCYLREKIPTKQQPIRDTKHLSVELCHQYYFNFVVQISNTWSTEELTDCVTKFLFLTNVYVLINELFQLLNIIVFFFLSTDTSYHLAVKTGEMALAGTDANVYFQLIGDEGETEKIQLRQGGKAEKRFEKGRIDKFIVETVDVGTVQTVVVNNVYSHRCTV